MTRQEYTTIETFMLDNMKDSAHDKHHIYRVLNAAIDIAAHESDVNTNILIAACLLHDIGRDAQAANPALCHAQVGAEMAYEFLQNLGWQTECARHVRECIASHRYRGDNAPQSIEAKILFDADKLEVSGAIGIARTLIYAGQYGSPMYIIDEGGSIRVDKQNAGEDSFLGEYNFKLKNVYGSFYTVHAKNIAAKRQKAAKDFYNSLHAEITENYENGIAKIEGVQYES